MRTTSPDSVREPDDAPHALVGLTSLVTLGAGAGSFIALASGGAAAAIALIAVVLLVIALDRRAAA